jgi:hypothetical protein
MDAFRKPKDPLILIRDNIDVSLKDMDLASSWYILMNPFYIAIA